jgi:hypothetical protein
MTHYVHLPLELRPSVLVRQQGVQHFHFIEVAEEETKTTEEEKEDYASSDEYDEEEEKEDYASSDEYEEKEQEQEEKEEEEENEYAYEEFDFDDEYYL